MNGLVWDRGPVFFQVIDHVLIALVLGWSLKFLMNYMKFREGDWPTFWACSILLQRGQCVLPSVQAVCLFSCSPSQSCPGLLFHPPTGLFVCSLHCILILCLVYFYCIFFQFFFYSCLKCIIVSDFYCISQTLAVSYSQLEFRLSNCRLGNNTTPPLTGYDILSIKLKAKWKSWTANLWVTSEIFISHLS